MTSKELDERIAILHKDSGATLARLNFAVDVELLIRDCIEAVTPERKDSPDYDDDRDHYKYCPYSARDLVLEQNEAIDTIESNMKGLLG